MKNISDLPPEIKKEINEFLQFKCFNCKHKFTFDQIIGFNKDESIEKINNYYYCSKNCFLSYFTAFIVNRNIF